MNFENKPVLCGSLFFFLMTLDKASKKKSCYVNGENAEGITEQEMLLSWIDITKDNKEINRHDAIDTAISKYKNCSSDNISNFRFDSTLFVDDTTHNFPFKDEIVVKVRDFVSAFLISESAASLLCRRLISIILDDPTIADSEEFYLENNFIPMKKSDINREKVLYVEPVLYGIWYYIITKRIKNLDCKDNFDKFFIRGTERAVKVFDEKGFVFNKNTPDSIPLLPQSEIDYNIEMANFFKENAPKGDELKKIEEAKTEASKHSVYGKYSTYVSNAVSDKIQDKMLLNPMIERNFYDYFVANNVSKYSDKDDVLYSPTPKTITEKYGHFMCLMGEAGFGKSMLLKHMLLCDTMWDGKFGIESSKLVPVLVKIVDYKNRNISLLDLLFEEIQKYDSSIKKEDFSVDLEEGLFFFLLDGLDEIDLSIATELINELNDFCTKYKNNYFLLSSRIDELSAGMLKKFITLSLLPFTKYRAEKLIKKFKTFDEYEDKTCDSFIEKLKKNKMTPIEENPLLLTIKFMIYANKGEYLGRETFRFYKKAYETLYDAHDLLDNNLTRKYKTGLSREELHEVLSEFCFYSFFNHDYIMFEEEISELFETLDTVKKYGIKEQDFIHDITKNLNLVKLVDGAYTFLHRSFQEYFAAAYMVSQPKAFFDDEMLDYIDSFSYSKETRFIHGKPRKYFLDFSTCETTFDLMQEMRQAKFIQCLALPKLKEVYGEASNPVDFLHYIKNVYGEALQYHCGHVPPEEETCTLCHSEIISYLVENFTEFETVHMCGDMADYEDFVQESFYLKGYDEDNMPHFWKGSEIEIEYPEGYDEEKWKPSGVVVQIDMDKIINNPNKYASLIEDLNGEFGDEYLALLEVYKGLDSEYRKK